MAGVARPNDDMLIGSKKEMTDYEIINYNNRNSGTASNLFNASYLYGYDGYDWNYDGDYMTIKINKPCNLYIHLNKDYLGQKNSLNITPTTYENTYNLSSKIGWQLYVTELLPGIYTFTHKNGYRYDSEWFFEEVIIISDKIKNAVKEAILNHELIQEHLIPCGIEGDD